MNVPRAVSLALRTMLATALLAACASSPSSPPKPITEIRQIEGKWRGTISFNLGPDQFYYLTIHPDGSLVARWGMNWQWDKVTLSGVESRIRQLVCPSDPAQLVDLAEYGATLARGAGGPGRAWMARLDVEACYSASITSPAHLALLLALMALDKIG